MWNLGKNLFKYDSPVIMMVRHVRKFRGVKLALSPELNTPPETSKSFEEIMAERNKKDPTIDFKVDIGLPPPKPISRKELLEIKEIVKKRKNNPELERKSRLLKLNPNFDVIREEWARTMGGKHIKAVAEHYNVFDDLFGDAYFTPYVIMDIYYPQKNNDLVAPVYRGNVVKPTEAFHQPVVKFNSKPDELWTLTLVNPDGHFTKTNMEYILWCVGNIPGGDVSKGEVIWDYLPPFPPRGIGFQRFIFVLYKQEKKIDYSKLKKELPCLELEDRSFQTLEFYRERQDDMTPAGLSFFQSDWDKTSRLVFHEILNMEEPVFKYAMPPKSINAQRWFPLRKPFDLYLDKYRDPRDIAREYLLKKLKDLDPFKPPEKPYKYPKAIKGYKKGLPSWLATKEIRYRMGRGRVTELVEDEYE